MHPKIISASRRNNHTGYSPRKMASSTTALSHRISLPTVSSCLFFLLLVFFVNLAASHSGHRLTANQTFQPHSKLQSIKRIRAYLRKINKPAVKTIQSLYGDIIDCVPSNLQPAFDHPQLKGQKPLEPPERPNGHDSVDVTTESIQYWTNITESCPEGTIPVRRTTAKDVLRVNTIQKFGRKTTLHDTVSNKHEHAVAFVNGDRYYGAKAKINVWSPQVADQNEFSLSQVWVISGSFSHDLNTIEAGWQVNPELYGDSYPRFFTYWTNDGYQTTGCYNLLCSGFVQTNNRIAIGAVISPRSSYRSKQFDIGIMIWKDPKHGNWWLEFGSGLVIGYWPSFLFSHLRIHANMLQFGGEIVNSKSGFHTSTQMGSGHFADEGFGKASYVRNMQVVDWDNNLLPLSNIHLLADHPTCYDIRAGKNDVWENYIYYGGPGRNQRCS